MKQEKTNLTFDVFSKIDDADFNNWNLIVDAIYNADPKKKNLSADVISKLCKTGNQGGFRFLGTKEFPKLVILFTSGEDIYWHDEIDTSIGLLLYYGDNKISGNDLHKTKLHGNEILKNIFTFATSENKEDRLKIPPVLVFTKAGGRNVKFLGLAVPGISGKPKKRLALCSMGMQ